jgi:hypothetical protein
VFDQPAAQASVKDQIIGDFETPEGFAVNPSRD